MEATWIEGGHNDLLNRPSGTTGRCRGSTGRFRQISGATLESSCHRQPSFDQASIACSARRPRIGDRGAHRWRNGNAAACKAVMTRLNPGTVLHKIQAGVAHSVERLLRKQEAARAELATGSIPRSGNGIPPPC